jgi:DNA-binding XRE family transcriptional regulator
MLLMAEYLIERVPTGRRPAYEDELPPVDLSTLPVPPGFTRVRGGAALLLARELAGLTQLELSRELRVSQADLSKMETGKRPIGKRLARKFAHRFRMDYRDFL